MTDNELRGIVLEKLYELRDQGPIVLSAIDFGSDVDTAEAARVCNQLAQHDLICWRPAKDERGRVFDGAAEISADGVDVKEGKIKSTISINLDYSQHVSVVASPHTQVGNGNVQRVSISVEIEKIISAIDHSTASEAEKREAKSLLKRFLEHPLVTSIAGGIASTLKP